MKTLKFTSELCEKILAGTKTSTWRMFDDKNLQEGDDLQFLNQDTLKVFGTAHISQLVIKTLGSLEENDWKGHERFESEETNYVQNIPLFLW